MRAIVRPKFAIRLAFKLFAGWMVATNVHAVDFTSSYVHMARGMPALLHEPVKPGPKSNIGVLILHPSADVLLKPTWAEQLVTRAIAC